MAEAKFHLLRLPARELVGALELVRKDFQASDGRLSIQVSDNTQAIDVPTNEIVSHTRLSEVLARRG